jgi:transglutaminase-like putative cysteine protease
MKYRVRHITEYKYDSKVNTCYNRAHVLPRETPTQNVDTPRVVILPTPTSGSRRTDYFGNRVYHFSIQEPHTSLTIDVSTNITVKPLGNIYGNQLGYGNTCEQVQQALSYTGPSIETIYAREFLLNSPMIRTSQSLQSFAQSCFSPQKPFLTAVMDLTHKIYTEFEFDASVTSISTPLDELMNHKRGVCQDFAHLAIGCLRSLGYAARYISGYLETLPPPGQQRLVGADATHAWFSVYSPREGWFEFDPTNDSVPTFQHIVTAWGRDYSDVSPLRGVVFGGGRHQKLSVSVDVARIPSQEE